MSKLHKQILPHKSYLLLQKIRKNESFRNFYLAGGTALALQIGHRKSYDFDFFSEKEFSSTLLTKFDKPYEVIALHNNSIELIKDETKVMFMFFGFKLMKPLLKIENVIMANPIDIGLMKLLALQGRSTRKDIVDLYFIDKLIIKLEGLLKLFESHYPKESFNSYKSLKMLIDESELNKEPMPRMMMQCNWDEALKLVKQKIALHMKNLLLG